jgi:SanA protein
MHESQEATIAPETHPSPVKTKPAKALNKKTWLLILLVVISPPLAMFLIYQEVESHKDGIYGSVAAVPQMPAAIVFGAGINSLEFHDRIATAVSLYKEGKVGKLLMTGDNRYVNYNEPIAMKKAAVSLGVPEEDITCDFAGFRTYDSLYRARDIFGVKQAVLVSQRYHLPRAIFLAQNLGLQVVGVDAAIRSYGAWQSWYDVREVAASEAAWFDVITRRKPKFLGKKEPLFPESVPANLHR